VSDAPVPTSKPRPSQSGPDPLLGRVINDRFKIVAMVARGGMGKVYRAEQAPLGREVALKVLNPNYNGDQDPEFHKRFFLEASICSKLTHPNTVTIFDYGRTDDDVYFIAMELLEGRTLHRALREEGPFPPGRALHIARQIARSLREAHGMGVVHRDLKPANVYLVKHGDETDFVKVLDFGLVKNVADTGEDLTQTGLFMGSPKYMAPEQIRGERTDARSDVYALGVILYEMLTGKVPFDRSSSVNILMAHVHEPPQPFAVINPNVSVPASLEAVVMKALGKTPEERWDSMDELLVALKNLATDSGQSFAGGASLELGTTGRFAASAVDPMRVSVSGSGPVVRVDGHSGPHTGAGAASQTPPGVSATVVGSTSPQVPVEPAHPDRTALYVGVGLAIVALLGVVSYAIRSEPEAPVATVGGTLPREPSGEGAGATGPSTPPEPAVVRTLVSLRSTPSGATVTASDPSTPEGEGVAYGPTPADVEWSGADAMRGREVTFVFELRGHRPFSVTRTITGETLDVSAELEELPTGRPFRPRPPRRPEGDDESGHLGPVKGYKTDPY
jgi:eukaryotic-like serine/threonine-protein kinase